MSKSCLGLSKWWLCFLIRSVDVPVVCVFLPPSQSVVSHYSTSRPSWCSSSCRGLFLLLHCHLGEHISLSVSAWRSACIFDKLKPVSCFFLKALLTMFALQRYRQGIDEVGLGYNDPTSDHTSPYPSTYTGAPEGYQQSPFAASPAGQGGYQPPAYWGWRHFNASEAHLCGLFHTLHFSLFHKSLNCDLGLVCFASVFFHVWKKVIYFYFLWMQILNITQLSH